MPMTINRSVGEAFAAALQTNDQAQIAQAWDETIDSIAQRVRDDFAASNQAADRAVLAQRGYRQLTQAEERWYQAVAGAMRTADAAEARQAFADLIGTGKDEDLMPVTIIEDVFKELQASRPLLQAITFTYTGYATKWLRNKHQAAKAVWGKITAEITKEITSDFDTMKLDQNKLTCFAVIPLDILDMGYTFMDRYVRLCLMEAIYSGLESAIIDGNGIDTLVGLDRDIHEGVSFNTSTGYPKKTAVKVKSFDKPTYLGIVAKLAETERGTFRNFDRVGLIVNAADNITKIKPASTMLTQLGYVDNIFPFPTDVYPSVEIEKGSAIMFLPKCYTACIGGTRNGTIEFDDSFKFLEDARTFKVVNHGDGIADDDTAAVLLDISELEELVYTVQVANGTLTA